LSANDSGTIPVCTNPFVGHITVDTTIIAGTISDILEFRFRAAIPARIGTFRHDSEKLDEFTEYFFHVAIFSQFGVGQLGVGHGRWPPDDSLVVYIAAGSLTPFGVLLLQD
ncbi:hypothetical protein GNI_119400, partial [Gregarina niphandrodes]